MTHTFRGYTHHTPASSIMHVTRLQWRSQPNSDARAQIFYSQRNYMSRRWAHFHEGPKIMHIQYNLS